MNTLAPAAASTASDPPARSRLAELSPRQFRTLLLAMVALAAAMAAEGMQTFAEMRERHHSILARQQAVSPVSYGTSLPALHALAPAGPVRVVVRADSAGAQAAALCALARGTAGAAAVRWIALSAAVDPCVAPRLDGRPAPAGAPAAAELAGARWIVMDADGHARYSRRDVPSVQELRRTAALLAPLPEGAR